MELAARALPCRSPTALRGFPGRVRQRLTVGRRRRRLFAPAWVGAAAAAVVLAVFTPRLLRGPRDPAPTAVGVPGVPAPPQPAAPSMAAKAESHGDDAAMEAPRAEPHRSPLAKTDLRGALGRSSRNALRPQRRYPRPRL